MVSAGRHPKKEVAEALEKAKAAGIEIREIHRGHRWGVLICGQCEDATQAIYCTPSNSGNHARVILHFVLKHSHLRRVGE